MLRVESQKTNQRLESKIANLLQTPTQITGAVHELPVPVAEVAHINDVTVIQDTDRNLKHLECLEKKRLL